MPPKRIPQSSKAHCAVSQQVTPQSRQNGGETTWASPGGVNMTKPPLLLNTKGKTVQTPEMQNFFSKNPFKILKTSVGLALTSLDGVMRAGHGADDTRQSSRGTCSPERCQITVVRVIITPGRRCYIIDANSHRGTKMHFTHTQYSFSIYILYSTIHAPPVPNAPYVSYQSHSQSKGTISKG